MELVASTNVRPPVEGFGVGWCDAGYLRIQVLKMRFFKLPFYSFQMFFYGLVKKSAICKNYLSQYNPMFQWKSLFLSESYFHRVS